MAKEKSILNVNQQKLLSVISKNEDICKDFYFTGGTVLAEFYLQHRFSEDLDFFAEKEFEIMPLAAYFKSVQKKLAIEKVHFETHDDRNLFFFHLQSNEIIKTEFTFFPFPRIEKGKKINLLEIESLIDIAVNKLFTIYQKVRSRDFIDLYFILEEKKWDIADLIKKAKLKFDWHIDFLRLGSQFAQAQFVRDYPKMIKRINHKDWQDFFIAEAKKLKKDIFK